MTDIVKGTLVRRKGSEDINIVLSKSYDPVDGHLVYIRRIHPHPIVNIGNVQINALEPIDIFPGALNGDVIARLVAQNLVRHANVKGISLHAGATEFKPFQFTPLLRYLDNPRRRLLIADEVGLGKTISAIYIMIEEMSRSALDRVIIVCPAHLRNKKWKRELWRRFGLPFDIVNGNGLVQSLKKDRYRLIVSQDCMRKGTGRLEEAIGSKKIDLLIIDEIHNLIGRDNDTKRREFGIALSLMSERVVGLTATPVQLKLLDLKRIYDVIDPGYWDDEAFLSDMEIQANLTKACRLLSDIEWNDGKDVEVRSILSGLDRTISSSMNLSSIESRHKLHCSLGRTGPLASKYTRTRRVDVGEDRPREIQNIIIDLDEDIVEAIQDGVLVKVSEAGLFAEVDLLLKGHFSHVHRRQLSSSLPAMVGLMHRGMEGFRVWESDGRIVTEEDLSEMDEEDVVGFKEVRQCLSDEVQERCRSIVDKYNLRKADTKFKRMMDILMDKARSGDIHKAIVFTRWRPTLSDLRQKAMHIRDIRTFIISSDDPDDVQDDVIMRFQEHEGFAILFTADVLSEGLDMQCADCIVNYDMPYNPQRIEQRIGRVDRIGQKYPRITILNLLVKGSLDLEIFDILLSRIGVFEQYLGDTPPTLSEPIDIGNLDKKKISQEPSTLGSRIGMMPSI